MARVTMLSCADLCDLVQTRAGPCGKKKTVRTRAHPCAPVHTCAPLCALCGPVHRRAPTGARVHHNAFPQPLHARVCCSIDAHTPAGLQATQPRS